MLRILQESEENHFEGIATRDESWFQYSYPSSKVCTIADRCLSKDAASHWDEQNDDNNFFTGRKRIVLDIYQKEAKSASYTGRSISSGARAQESESRNVFRKDGFIHDSSLHYFLKPIISAQWLKTATTSSG
jgi:hypothetical protein